MIENISDIYAIYAKHLLPLHRLKKWASTNVYQAQDALFIRLNITC
jgi:hypothetical protein